VLINALIALPVYAVTRRWLQPSMSDELRRRRRRVPPRPSLTGLP
jgi:hypothetical protein